MSDECETEDRSYLDLFARYYNMAQRQIHHWALDKGFWPREHIIGDEYGHEMWHESYLATKCMLIVTEVAELVEELRKEYPDRGNINEELADIVIRTMDLGGALDLDVGHMIREKMYKNEQRPHKHGKRF